MELQQLFSLPTLFISLAISVLMNILKGWLEIKWPNISNNKNYNHAYLPTISIILGMIISLFSSMVPGFLANGTILDHVLNGIICGFASSYVWRGVNSFLHKELNIPESVYPDVNAIPPQSNVPKITEDKK